MVAVVTWTTSRDVGGVPPPVHIRCHVDGVSTA